jgi:hypothetical protein
MSINRRRGDPPRERLGAQVPGQESVPEAPSSSSHRRKNQRMCPAMTPQRGGAVADEATP